MKKRLLTLSLVAAMCVSFAACTDNGTSGSNDASTPSTTTPDNSTSQQEPVENLNITGLPILNEPETFTATVTKRPLSQNNFSEKEAVIATEAATNVKMEWTEVPESGWGERINIMFATGDLTEVIIGGVDVVQNLSMLQRLDSYVESHAPYVNQLFTDMPELKSALQTSDGGIYSFSTGEPAPWLDTGSLIYINQTWLDTLGLDTPSTTEDFKMVLEAIKDGDPNGNAQADEIPLSFQGVANLYPLFSSFGIAQTNKHAQVIDGKITFTGSMDSFYDALVYLHDLYNNGLLDVEAFSQSGDQLVAKGKLETPVLGSFVGFLDDSVTGDNYTNYRVLPLLASPNVDTPVIAGGAQTPGNLGGFVVTKECESPEVMVRWYDYINSSFENRMLWMNGPEGTAWVLNEEGKWTTTNDNIPEGLTWGELRHTIGVGSVAPILSFDSDPDVRALDERTARRNDGVDVYRDFFPTEQLPIGFEDPTIKEERDILYVDIDAYMLNFIATSVIEGIDEAGWTAHLETCERLRVDEYVNLWQQVYDSKN